MHELRSPDQRATQIARRQHGLLSRADAAQCGLTDRMVARRIGTGAWRRLTSGVYVVGGAPDTARQRTLAACLAVGGIASHQSALAVAGLVPWPVLPHVTVPPGRSGRSPVARVHRSAVAAPDRRIVDAIPCTTVARAVVEVARSCAHDDLAELVDAACCERLATRDSILRALGRVGTPWQGRQPLVAALETWREDIDPDSPAEMRLLRQVQAWGFGGAVLQHEVRDADGAFVARLDVAWPAHLAALEYDSVRHHGPRAFERDERRYAALGALGWRVDGVTKHDLRPGEHRLLDLRRRWVPRAA